jgi:hypothetical protein
MIKLTSSWLLFYASILSGACQTNSGSSPLWIEAEAYAAQHRVFRGELSDGDCFRGRVRR